MPDEAYPIQIHPLVGKEALSTVSYKIDKVKGSKSMANKNKHVVVAYFPGTD